MARALGRGGLEAADAIEAYIAEVLGTGRARAKRSRLDATPVSEADLAAAAASVARMARGK